ncbi:MAG: DUF3307 domain-containing protein [Defluviitaleaceae bacterium]|nr:DUF3307 domain-containing protein [Defluviitaleaceae bacterium]
MTLPPILTTLLLAHVLGDFYLQPNIMAEKKRISWGWLFLHGLIYMLCMATILLISTEFSKFTLFLIIGAGATHLAIDALKKHITQKNTIPKIFTIDQALHITILIIFVHIWGQCLSFRNSAVNMLDYFPANFPLILLGLLWILKPVGVLIGQGDIWDFNKGESIPTPSSSQKGAGKMIGYLERIIVFFLLINGQFGAIAFVLTAKSVMRFPEIRDSENATSLAEYYIIGTLLSMTSVFVLTFLLGLI